MSLIKAMGFDGLGINPRQFQLGDVLCAAEQLPATIAANAVSVTGQLLANSLIQSTETANATYTLDTAANIILALQNIANIANIQNGTSWRLRHVNNAAFTVTYASTANTGTSVALPTINASSVKEFLITVINGTPAQTFACTTTNASAVLGGLTQSQCAQLSPGMIVTNAVAGLQGDTILAVNASAGTVTMSGNANATNAVAVAVSFSPVVALQGLGQGLL